MTLKPIETAPRDGSCVMTRVKFSSYFEPMHYIDGLWLLHNGEHPLWQPKHWLDLKNPGDEPDVTEGVALTEEQARILDAVNAAPIAKSLEADFAKMTWTFCINQGCRVGVGRYALVRID